MACIIKGVRLVMGTFVKIVVAHPRVDEARDAVRMAFDEIYRISDLMSIHRESSEVSTLNKNGFYQGVSDDIKHVIRRANYFSDLSDGIFDITILPILKLWEERAHTGRIPTGAEIDKTLELVNYRNTVIQDGNIRFKKAGMGITLAGVAKGYAVDKAVTALQQGNIRHAMVNAGGDIRVIGGKTGTMPWRIAVRDPRNKRRLSTTVELHEQAIATSGTYQRPFNDIIDPKVGRPAQGLLSSTIITDRAIDADILATCVYILGAERGMELLKKLNGVEALLIKSDGNVLKFT